MAFNKEKVMDAARKFVDKGQIDKAVKEYLRIVHEDPKDVRVWLKIGDLYAKKGAKQDAIETYLKVARFYHDQGFFLKAVAVYKQILKLDPRLVDVILKLAELYRQLGLMSDAMQHFESVAAHFHREGNTKEALATVKKLVDLDPENIATRIKLAELYSKESLVDDAASEFSVACEQLRRQGRQDDFLKVAERLLWHKPDNQALNRELAGLYLRRNDPRRALQKLQACFKADPRDVETLGLLAQAFQALEQKAKTVSVLKELARIHGENKHRDLAGDVFRKILELIPSDADAIAFLGPAAQPVRPSQSVPVPRPPTQMPAQIRAATDARFNLTSDMPSYEPASARMTGSMPLIDEEALAGVDFALPEYDDSDFSADMEPPPDPRKTSAAGERHAEEISKILAETDVYVKYGLHHKAIDHLRRVFGLDADNVEAHERLKDILVSQGREQEAEVELLRLAEVVAPSDPDRAEAYLHELLQLNGTHTGAFDLARRFRLRVARMSSASAEVHAHAHDDYGAIQLADSDLDELAPLELGASHATPSHGRALNGASRGKPRDSIDDFDPDELIGKPVAHGSPAPGRPPRRPELDPNAGYAADHDAFEFESPSQDTRQLADDVAAALAGAADDLDDPADSMRPPGAPARWSAQRAAERALDRQLDDAELGDDIDREVAHELGHVASEDLPFDPDEARAFDAAVPKGGELIQTDAIYVGDLGHAGVPTQVEGAMDSSVYDAVPDDALHAGGYDPYGTEALHTPASYADPTSVHAVGDFPIDDDISAVDAPRSEPSVEDDLDEAEFFAGQGMYAEAVDVLTRSLNRFPGNRLVLAKLRELRGGHDATIEQDALDRDTVGTDALDLDAIEDLGLEDLVELDSESQPVAASKKRRPTVMLEKPLDEGDSDTHYDLGLAYKEMTLLDDAIKSFEKALRAPGREVQCRVMIGMCLREQGNPTEAIHQFKQGLHAEPSERERQSLYYEIGMTYEAIGDDSESLYYFEMVMKRDPGFADAAMRAERLRARGGRAMHAADDDL